MPRKIMLAIAWIAFTGLLGISIILAIAANGYYFNLGFQEEATIAGLYYTLWFALALGVPVLIRWWLKNVSWGTFAVYTMVLAAGFYTQGIFRSLIGETELASTLRILGILFFFYSCYLMWKNLIQVKHLLEEVQKKPKKR